MGEKSISRRENSMCKDPCKWWVLHNNFVLSFTFCSNSGEEVSLPPSKNEFSCIIIYTLASFEPLSIVFFLLYSQLLSPLDISLQDIILKYLWPTTHKMLNKNFSESYIPLFYFLSFVIFISKTSRITVFSTYNFHFLNFHSLSNPTKYGILHTTLLAGSCQGDQWLSCHKTQ